MNLPYSVLGYIPWFNTYQSSKMGPEPQPDGGFNLILWLLSMANPVLNNAIALLVSMTGIEIFAYLKEYCENVFMNVLTAVGDLLWILIRAAVLVVSWIFFAFMLLLVMLLLVIVSGVMIAVNLFFNIEICLDINELNVFGDISFKFGYTIFFEYIEFFDLYLPSLCCYFNSTEFSIELVTRFITFEFNIYEFPSNLFTRSSGTEEIALTSQQSESLLNSSSNGATSIDAVVAGLTALGVSMGMFSSFIGLMAGAITLMKDEKIKQFFYWISLISFGASFVVLILNAFCNPDDFQYAVINGMALGLLISGSVLFLTFLSLILTKYGFMAKFERIFGSEDLFDFLGLIDATLSMIGATIDIEDLIRSILGLDDSEPLIFDDKDAEMIIISLSSGIFALFLAIQAIYFLSGKYEKLTGFWKKFYRTEYLNRKDKAIISLIYCGLSIVIGITLLILNVNLNN